MRSHPIDVQGMFQQRRHRWQAPPVLLPGEADLRKLLQLPEQYLTADTREAIYAEVTRQELERNDKQRSIFIGIRQRQRCDATATDAHQWSRNVTAELATKFCAVVKYSVAELSWAHFSTHLCLRRRSIGMAWGATITIEGVPTVIGSKFQDEVVAARAHDMAALLLSPTRSTKRLNFAAWTYATDLMRYKFVSRVRHPCSQRLTKLGFLGCLVLQITRESQCK